MHQAFFPSLFCIFTKMVSSSFSFSTLVSTALLSNSALPVGFSLLCKLLLKIMTQAQTFSTSESEDALRIT